jgi:hypothetical protein
VADLKAGRSPAKVVDREGEAARRGVSLEVPSGEKGAVRVDHPAKKEVDRLRNRVE